MAAATVYMLTQGDGSALTGDRLCRVCHSLQDVEDEQHFIFDCPVNQKHVEDLLQTVFLVGNA